MAILNFYPDDPPTTPNGRYVPMTKNSMYNKYSSANRLKRKQIANFKSNPGSGVLRNDNFGYDWTQTPSSNNTSPILPQPQVSNPRYTADPRLKELAAPPRGLYPTSSVDDPVKSISAVRTRDKDIINKIPSRASEVIRGIANPYLGTLTDMPKTSGLSLPSNEGQYKPGLLGDIQHKFSMLGKTNLFNLPAYTDPSEFANLTKPELNSAIAGNISRTAKIGGMATGAVGALSAGVQLYSLLKNPLPMMMRPQQVSEVEYDSPVAAVGGSLREDNRQALASGLAANRAAGGAGSEGFVAGALKNNLAVASLESQMINDATTRQTTANTAIRMQNAQMALDYGAYKDDYKRAERDRKDAMRNSLLSTITTIPASILQQNSDAMATIAGLYTGTAPMGG